MKLNRHIHALHGLSLLLAVGASSLAAAQENTSEGTGALIHNTTGVGNDAFGANALYWNTTGSQNMASGYDALAYNTTGSYNGANGSYSLLLNTTGSYNTASGYQTLYYNTSGNYNNAIGAKALLHNTTGVQNNGSGYGSLYSNTTGNYNSGYGAVTLYVNTTGTANIANGYGALYRNTTGSYNSAEGFFALGFNTTGGYNIAVGPYAGYNLTTGSNNIDIGNRGAAAETGVMRLGTLGTQRATFIAGVSGVNVTGGATVVVNSSGQIGVMSSSRRYKEDIRSMGDTSERLLKLRPVTFRYKQADEKGQKPEQYGLIAEEVAKVMPELVVYNQNGQPETVAYQTLAPLLLNELQREHGQVAALQAEVQELRRVTAQLVAARGLAQGDVQSDGAIGPPQ